MQDTSPGTAEVTCRLGAYEVTVATEFGPRLTNVRLAGGDDLLLRLPPDLTVDGFRFRGGHRLWATPEVPSITYAADDHPCRVEEEDGRILVSAPPDAAALAKQIELTADGDGLVVDHRLTWTGPGSITLGAWAITQVPLGGKAIVPLRGVDGTPALQADRSLVLWPYTDLSDDRLALFASAALITAEARPTAFKVGTGPAPGQVGYLRDGWLLTKTFAPAGNGDYADRGAVAQVFTNQRFCEVESLGPMMELSTGATVAHRETWHIERCPDIETAIERVMEPRR